MVSLSGGIESETDQMEWRCSEGQAWSSCGLELEKNKVDILIYPSFPVSEIVTFIQKVQKMPKFFQKNHISAVIDKGGKLLGVL